MKKEKNNEESFGLQASGYKDTYLSCPATTTHKP